MRLQVEGMRYAIVETLQQRSKEIEQYVEETLKTLDIQEIVKQAVISEVPKILREAVVQHCTQATKEAIAGTAYYLEPVLRAKIIENLESAQEDAKRWRDTKAALGETQ